MPESTSESAAIRHDATRGGGVLLRLRQLHRISRLADIHHSALLFILTIRRSSSCACTISTSCRGWKPGRRAGWSAPRVVPGIGEVRGLVLPGDAGPRSSRLGAGRSPRIRGPLPGWPTGDPLLPNETRVANDVQVGPAGSVLLVTGSNMSGRARCCAIGVNAALAQVGARVVPGICDAPGHAGHQHADPRFLGKRRLAVHGRVAALEGYRGLGRRRPAATRPHAVVPVDEILLGTNSKERHIAVVRALQHLLEQAPSEPFRRTTWTWPRPSRSTGVCRCVHFRETLHDQHAERPMTFDYQLRLALATTTNALRLLEIVGLGGPIPPGGEPPVACVPSLLIVVRFALEVGMIPLTVRHPAGSSAGGACWRVKGGE